LLERLGQELVRAAGFRDARGLVVREDHRGGVMRQCDFDDFPRVDARLRQGASENVRGSESGDAASRGGG
jgi:hypothetical protein